jgi:hypothetical protein
MSALSTGNYTTLGYFIGSDTGAAGSRVSIPMYTVVNPGVGTFYYSMWATVSTGNPDMTAESALLTILQIAV